MSSNDILSTLAQVGAAISGVPVPSQAEVDAMEHGLSLDEAIVRSGMARLAERERDPERSLPPERSAALVEIDRADAVAAFKSTPDMVRDGAEAALVQSDALAVIVQHQHDTRRVLAGSDQPRLSVWALCGFLTPNRADVPAVDVAALHAALGAWLQDRNSLGQQFVPVPGVER